MSEVNANESVVVSAGGEPWSMLGVFASFADADSKRKSVSGAFTKVRRRSDGTFTVHARSKSPGKATSKPEKKKRSYGK